MVEFLLFENGEVRSNIKRQKTEVSYARLKRPDLNDQKVHNYFKVILKKKRVSRKTLSASISRTVEMSCLQNIII